MVVCMQTSTREKCVNEKGSIMNGDSEGNFYDNIFALNGGAELASIK